MSELHNALTRGNTSAAVQRALGVSNASGGGVERYGETLEPVMNPWGMPEWAYLRGERLAGCVETVSAVAGENGMLALVNPADSGLLIVLEHANNRGASSAYLGLASEAGIVATLSGVGTPLPRDSRGGPTPTTLLPLRARLWSGTDPSLALATGALLDVQATTVAFQNLPLVISPGWGAVVALVTVNILAQIVLGWRERNAYPGEL